jgi:hypothetical protein
MSAADMSFHDLSVINPGVAAHPITWTDFHLRTMNCIFNQIIDNVLFRASEDKARTATVKKLATRHAPTLKLFYVAELLIRPGRRPLSFVQ